MEIANRQYSIHEWKSNKRDYLFESKINDVRRWASIAKKSNFKQAKANNRNQWRVDKKLKNNKEIENKAKVIIIKQFVNN